MLDTHREVSVKPYKSIVSDRHKSP